MANTCRANWPPVKRLRCASDGGGPVGGARRAALGGDEEYRLGLALRLRLPGRKRVGNREPLIVRSADLSSELPAPDRVIVDPQAEDERSDERRDDDRDAQTAPIWMTVMVTGRMRPRPTKTTAAGPSACPKPTGAKYAMIIAIGAAARLVSTQMRRSNRLDMRRRPTNANRPNIRSRGLRTQTATMNSKPSATVAITAPVCRAGWR